MMPHPFDTILLIANTNIRSSNNANTSNKYNNNSKNGNHSTVTIIIIIIMIIKIIIIIISISIIIFVFVHNNVVFWSAFFTFPPTQIDDVLLNTPFDHAADGLSKYSNYTKNGGGAGYDLSNPTIVALLKQYNSNANTGYRFTPTDVGRLVAWRNKMLSIFPAGSDYT